MIDAILAFMGRRSTSQEESGPSDAEKYSETCLEPVFHLLDKQDLLNCMLTCRQFYTIISSDAFWVQHARFNGREDVLPPLSWRRAAVQKRFEGNEDGSIDVSNFNFDVMKIVLGRRGFSVMTPKFFPFFRAVNDQIVNGVLRSDDFSIRAGGNGIKFESSNSEGCDPHPDVSECFAFSFSTCSMYTFIDLVDAGIPAWILDHVRPKIRITQKVNHRNDCSAEMMFAAQLNYNPTQWVEENANQQISRNCDNLRFKSINKQWLQWSEAKWEDVELEFEGYPSGIRHLTVLNQGKDGQFWAGFYGPKFANLKIQVILPDQVAIKPLQEDSERRREDNEPVEHEPQLPHHPLRHRLRAWGVPAAVLRNFPDE